MDHTPGDAIGSVESSSKSWVKAMPARALVAGEAWDWSMCSVTCEDPPGDGESISIAWPPGDAIPACGAGRPAWA